MENGQIVNASEPAISAQCLRVACVRRPYGGGQRGVRQKALSGDHFGTLGQLPSRNGGTGLPSSPEKFLTYFDDPARPQTRLDRDLYGGMGISIGRLREDPVLDYKFVCLSHNTLRGAAGGGVLSAEYLCKLGYIPHK